MRIAFLAAGAAGMYCGSCLRDNAVAKALLGLRHEVTFVPLYTPLKVDGESAAINQVFFGGINVYLQQVMPFFRHTPRFIDRLFDTAPFFALASKFAGMTKPQDLGELTVSTLAGERGFQAKELRRLGEWLRDEIRPEIINLPNAMFAGAARELRRATGAPIVCSLTGEDLFLEGLDEPYKSRALKLLRERCAEIDAFVATSGYYADFMADYMAVPRDRIHVIPLGVNPDDFGRRIARPVEPFTIGFLARLAPEKGLHHLAEAFILLRAMPGGENARLRAAGWMGPREREYVDGIQKRLAEAGLADAFDLVGEVTFKQKLEFLDSLSVMSTPTVYRDPKGLPVFEALAHCIPVVIPAHGAFPEWIEATGGGLLHEPENPRDLAEKLHAIMTDREAADRMALRGQQAVRSRFTATAMGRATLELYETLLNKTNGAQSMGADHQLRVAGLRREYPAPGGPLVVLDGVDFDLASGASMAIMGPSGSGKSTLLQIIGALDSPTAGEVKLDGANPFDLADAARADFRSRSVGFVFQDHHLLPQLTVLENVMLPALANPAPGIEARAKELIEAVGLTSRAHHRPGELSGGERQRAAVARALINRPALLLCDEPTGNLDARNAEAVGAIFRDLQTREKTMIIAVTHSADFANLFDHQFKMSGGRLEPA